MQLQTEGGQAKYGSVISGLKSIWQDGGVRGFFQGNGLNCAKILPESAAKFFVYEHIKRALASGSPSNELSIGQRFVAGSVAGALSQVID
jgi:solute carrier family 25 (mitochondrial phosphate transporter), member 23/24/25/41